MNLSPNSLDQEEKKFINISHENLILDCQKGISISIYQYKSYFNYLITLSLVIASQLSQSFNYFSPLQVLTAQNNYWMKHCVCFTSTESWWIYTVICSKNEKEKNLKCSEWILWVHVVPYLDNSHQTHCKSTPEYYCYKLPKKYRKLNKWDTWPRYTIYNLFTLKISVYFVSLNCLVFIWIPAFPFFSTLLCFGIFAFQ